MLNKINEKLKKSPINYFSDLFIAGMVIAWLFVIIAMVIFAVYSTIMYGDNSIWSDLGTLVAVPLSCGGAIWMIKNGVQHAIANSKGERAHMDFPRVDDDIDINGFEKAFEGADSYEEKECTEGMEDADGTETEDVFENDN